MITRRQYPSPPSQPATHESLMTQDQRPAFRCARCGFVWPLADQYVLVSKDDLEEICPPCRAAIDPAQVYDMPAATQAEDVPKTMKLILAAMG